MLVYHRGRVWLENSLPFGVVGARVGAGQVQKQVVEGNDPHRGHGRVCDGEWYLPVKMEQSVPKLRHINFIRRGITQKEAYNRYE
jgi:hypothetical protein